MSSIKFDQGRFQVSSYPGEPGQYLVTFPLADTELKRWATAQKMKPFRDDPEDGNPVKWMVVCDRSALALIKLTFGGAV